MTVKTPASVTIDGRLYDKLLAALASHECEDCAKATVELVSVIKDDWCEDDGDGYCGNHDAWIAYHVDNFGPDGKVLKPGTFTDDDIAFAVCSSSNLYDSALAE